MYRISILTSAIQCLVFFGVVGLIGYLIRQPGKKWLAITIGSLVLFPVSVFLPWQLPTNAFIWMGAFILLVVMFWQPSFFPHWLWNRCFSLLYFSSINLLIAAWSLIHQQPVVYGWLVLLTLVAGGLGFRQILFSKN